MLISVFSVFFAFYFLTPVPPVFAASSDAIAIRVIPNPNYYSPLRWYDEQGFSGSPQMLSVDGYDAIRDGRTVYVNAANISGGTLYANIYLISYNQDAEKATTDIFGRILKHWKFNTNITGIGNCDQTTGNACLIDADCPRGEYCNSPKAKIIRDTKRLSDLAEINIALENYKNAHGRYPVLSAGTYLPNTTVSTWPSWKDTFAKELKIPLPIDPINRLGSCPGYDKTTCWNKETKKFADSDASDPNINPPPDSNVFIYASANQGDSYNLCSIMGSGYIQGAEQGACSDSASKNYEGGASNQKPEFAGSMLIGRIGEEFSGYITAIDKDGDKLSWSINTSGTNWSSWSAAPILKDSSAPNQKKVYAAKAGPKGNYEFSATVNDGRGEPNSKTTQIFTIKITNDDPIVSADNVVFTASSTKPVNFKFSAIGRIAKYPLTYSVSRPLPPAIHGLGESFAKTGNTYYYKVNGFLNDSNVFASPNSKNDYKFTLTATDSGGAAGKADFTVTIINHPPQIALSNSCFADMRINNPHICKVTASDPENNSFTFSPLSGAPAGISINTDTGEISGAPEELGIFTVIVKAADEYGYSSQTSYKFSVNSYCGDGIIRSPNTEGVYEYCDDANTIDGDGCSSDCVVEDGWGCLGEPSFCVRFCELNFEFPCIFKN